MKFYSLSTVLLVSLLLLTGGASATPGAISFSSGDVTPTTAVISVQAAFSGPISAELSQAADFSQIEKSKTTLLLEDNGLSAKLLFGGLKPNTEYFYRFKNHFRHEGLGKFSTPSLQSETVDVSFGWVGSQSLKSALSNANFASVSAASESGLDFIAHIGGSRTVSLPVRGDAPSGAAMSHHLVESISVVENLSKAARRVASIYVTKSTDRSEPEANAGSSAEVEALLDLGKAVDSRLSVNDESCSKSPEYRQFKYGSEVEVFVLDEESCRTPTAETACLQDPAPTLAPDARIRAGLTPSVSLECLSVIKDTSRTRLGQVQKTRFLEGLAGSSATYKVVLSASPWQEIFEDPYNRWEGYAAERGEVLQYLYDMEIENVVFLSTESTLNMIGGVELGEKDDSKTVAVEIISASSADEDASVRQVLQGRRYDIAVDNSQAECVDVGRSGYGLVEFSDVSQKLSVELKDVNGYSVVDMRDGSNVCELTL